MTDCPATREAVEELTDLGLGPDCELCGLPGVLHSSEPAEPNIPAAVAAALDEPTGAAAQPEDKR